MSYASPVFHNISEKHYVISWTEWFNLFPSNEKTFSKKYLEENIQRGFKKFPKSCGLFLGWDENGGFYYLSPKAFRELIVNKIPLDSIFHFCITHSWSCKYGCTGTCTVDYTQYLVTNKLFSTVQLRPEYIMKSLLYLVSASRGSLLSPLKNHVIPRKFRSLFPSDVTTTVDEEGNARLETIDGEVATINFNKCLQAIHWTTPGTNKQKKLRPLWCPNFRHWFLRIINPVNNGVWWLFSDAFQVHEIQSNEFVIDRKHLRIHPLPDHCDPWEISKFDEIIRTSDYNCGVLLAVKDRRCYYLSRIARNIILRRKMPLGATYHFYDTNDWPCQNGWDHKASHCTQDHTECLPTNEPPSSTFCVPIKNLVKSILYDVAQEIACAYAKKYGYLVTVTVTMDEDGNSRIETSNGEVKKITLKKCLKYMGYPNQS